MRGARLTPEPLCTKLAFAVSMLALFLLTSCQTPATFVMVVVDTDAPGRVVSMIALVSRGGSASTHPEAYDWPRTGSTRDFTFPATFSIVPGGGPSDGTVTLQLELTFAGVSGSPTVTARRTARFSFAHSHQNFVRLFIPASCASLLAPPDHCVDTTVTCTLSRFCEERSGQTCGEAGRCVAVDVMPTPLLADGSVPDALTHDATSDGCVPHCSARECGDDGCGGSCGTCAAGTCAFDGRCACTPQCAGRECGSDGCTGSCGSCASGLFCDPSGRCSATCAPNCAGHECGTDGCGGSCGTCASGQTCNGAGQCACIPNCGGRVCGGDGCGGSCGSCGSGLVCTGAGTCASSCTPNCAGRNCGGDGCSGTCGACGAGQSCNGAGQCVCAPNCTGRACGNDGCGGSCGSCGGGQSCNGAGQCVCAPQCSGRNCGGDACGGSCGTCGSNAVCNGSGVCVACSQGASCGTGNPCTTGAIDCSSGAPVCNVSGNAAPGTGCPGGVCNGSGTCVACAAGSPCTPTNDCVASAVIDCSSGSPVCTPQTYTSNGTFCSSFLDGARCDGSGSCRCVPVGGQCRRCGYCNFSCSLACP